MRQRSEHHVPESTQYLIFVGPDSPLTQCSCISIPARCNVRDVIEVSLEPLAYLR